MHNECDQIPDGTTAEFVRYAQWSAALTEKELRWIKEGDPRAPTFPLPDGTTVKFIRYAQEEAERVRQFIKLL